MDGELDDVGSPTWPWLFQGREYNPHLRAYDFRARTLWPDLGRFGQEDPAGMTDSTNLYQALLGNWTGATDPSGGVVVMMHGIWSSGEWARKMSVAFTETWSRSGADAGQDVLNAVNRRVVKWLPYREGVFGAFNARSAAAGRLDRQTIEAGKSMAHSFREIRAKLLRSRTRVSEKVSVVAHSHGTAILLAAVRQNDRLFHLADVIMVGSDLLPSIDLQSLYDSSDRITNFFSRDDDVTRSIGAAGAFGFGDVYREGEKTLIARTEDEKLRQIPVPGISHAGDVEGTTPGSIPWMGTWLTAERYASILASYRVRKEREPESWVREYSVLRDFIGSGSSIPLPRMFRMPFIPVFHPSFLGTATFFKPVMVNDCPRC